jgi:hypothetical protein
MTVRLHGNEVDDARKFNRTENVRPIAPVDPDILAHYPPPATHPQAAPIRMDCRLRLQFPRDDG